MEKGYVFISNSTKPSFEKAERVGKIQLENVSLPGVLAALKLGYEVYYGINRNHPERQTCDLPIKFYDSHTYRSITNINDNKIAIDNLSKLIKNNNIEVIHCNTPIGGFVGRYCAHKYNVKHVIYTVHGFHFYKGAPLLKSIVIKKIEQALARWTDVIITMNQEDYEAALKFKLKKGGRVYKVHGVGITLEEYGNIKVNRINKRLELGIKENDIVCISAGDLMPRKNYQTSIKAIANVDLPNLHYLICGSGPERVRLEKMSKDLGVEERVHFLGFRNDVKELMCISDIFLFSSFQEGLPRSLMEAMAIGLPAVVSKIRGNTDLIDDGEGGFLCDPHSEKEFSDAILRIASDENMRTSMSLRNINRIREYDVNLVKKEIEEIYIQTLK